MTMPETGYGRVPDVGQFMLSDRTARVRDNQASHGNVEGCASPQRKRKQPFRTQLEPLSLPIGALMLLCWEDEPE
jgi:hypothetical protein